MKRRGFLGALFGLPAAALAMKEAKPAPVAPVVPPVAEPEVVRAVNPHNTDTVTCVVSVDKAWIKPRGYGVDGEYIVEFPQIGSKPRRRRPRKKA